jgi:hypothetical protein
VMQGIGLLLALGADQKIHGQSIYRVLFYLPPVLSGIVVAIVWKWLYQPYGGPINELLKAVGLSQLQHPWLGDGARHCGRSRLRRCGKGLAHPSCYSSRRCKTFPRNSATRPGSTEPTGGNCFAV